MFQSCIVPPDVGKPDHDDPQNAALRRLAAALAGLLLLPAAAFAQPAPLGKPGAERSQELTPFSEKLLQPTQPELLQKLETAQFYIKTQGWEKAVHLLQGLLDAPEDVFLPIKQTDSAGKELIVWSSQRTEADRLMRSLPAAGREFYQLVFGNDARDQLAEARRLKDPERLALVVQRFLNTPAGTEAAAQAGHLAPGSRPAVDGVAALSAAAGPGRR